MVIARQQVIEAYAGRINYIDHIAPIWLALPEQSRGRFLIGSQNHLQKHAQARWNIAAVKGRAGAEPTLVASYADEKSCKGPVAFLEHGAGQLYSPPDPNAKGTRLSVGLYLGPNPGLVERMAQVFPNARGVVVGSPRLEHLLRQPHYSEWTVLAWHWNQWGVPEARSAFTHYQDDLARWAQSIPGLVGHAHPRGLKPLAQLYRLAGIPVVEWSNDALARARVVVADNTSLLWEACALDIPVVLLDAPWYRLDVHHGLRFWEWADAGPRISYGGALPEAVGSAFSEKWTPVRRAAAQAVYGPLEGSIARAAGALLAWAK